MVTRVAFTALVALVAAQRLVEMRVSRRHEDALRARGAIESAPRQMAVMAALHGTWLVAMVVEVWWRQPPFRPGRAAAAFALFGAGQALRWSAQRALGPRWTTRVMTLPSEPPVTTGIYRYVRHPNYLGVVLEMAALPLVHGAVWTCVTCSAGNALLLVARIRAEEAALGRDNQYARHFGPRSRGLWRVGPGRR
jgi:methyltransferase